MHVMISLTNHARHAGSYVWCDVVEVCDAGWVQEFIGHLLLSDEHTAVLSPHSNGRHSSLTDSLECIL